MNVAKTCVVCSTERVHAYDPAERRYECSVCGVRSWPAADDPDLAAGTEPTLPAVDEQAAGRERMLGMWRAAARTAINAAREAERRTGAIDEGKAAPVVLSDESEPAITPTWTFPPSVKERS